MYRHKQRKEKDKNEDKDKGYDVGKGMVKMDYREMFREENDAVRERYCLAVERIEDMVKEKTAAEPFQICFQKMAEFYLLLTQVVEKKEQNTWENMTLEELAAWNHTLYGDILGENYQVSFANPAYAAKMLGADFGPLMAFLYAEIRAAVANAYEMRLTGLTEIGELLIQVYNLFEDEELPKFSSVKDVLYWYVSDYADERVVYRVREGVDPSLSFAADIIMESDLSDLRYLYQFGEYISESELQIASYLNTLPEKTIAKMADTYTEGYRKGFEVTGRDLSKKKSVVIRYELGFERMIRQAILNFRQMGLQVILYRATVPVINKIPGRIAGYQGTPANRQYDYDHRYDVAVCLDKALKERKLSMQKVGYERYQKEAFEYAGPAVVETFGEAPFAPVNCPQALAFSEKQEEIFREMRMESSMLVNNYIPGDETSFTIIAFPRPEISESHETFERIFAETIAVNTLDYEEYKAIQQVIIDALDTAEHVEITGRGGNRTCLRVQLHTLHEPQKETNFENCVADVNIPLGEVFTSPVLAGTEGLLHVQKVYIDGICFTDLTVQFENGRVVDYSCANMETEEESRKLVRQMIFKNQEHLPMGEFAIGTNTKAYQMGMQYGIQDKLPILIAEKTGPHFAVGDTCYSWSEDTKVYNPDGKEIIARDNEVSILRKEDASRAYFNCHTDITIPYSELGDIFAVRADGEKIAVIRDGKFALPGTEVLNEAL